MGTLRVGQAGGTAEEPRPPELWGVLVTYRRPDALKDFLDKLHNQTQRMAGVVVVDNGADDSAKEAAMAAGAEYIDAQGNTGPAGGIALGMEFVLGRAADHDWVVVFDDDDPPQDDDLLERVFWFALERLAVDENVGAVGTVGARYDRRTGIFRRVPDSSSPAWFRSTTWAAASSPTSGCRSCVRSASSIERCSSGSTMLSSGCVFARTGTRFSFPESCGSATAQHRVG